MKNKTFLPSIVFSFLWVTSCESREAREADFKDALSHNIEAVILYPTDVTVDGYNLVEEEILVSDSDILKKIIGAISSAEKYRPNHPRTDKAFRILIKVENHNDLDIRASLLTDGKVMLRYEKHTFISADLGGIILAYLEIRKAEEGLESQP